VSYANSCAPFRSLQQHDNAATESDVPGAAPQRAAHGALQHALQRRCIHETSGRQDVSTRL
jgi:hypothetical protein